MLISTDQKAFRGTRTWYEIDIEPMTIRISNQILKFTFSSAFDLLLFAIFGGNRRKFINCSFILLYFFLFGKQYAFQLKEGLTLTIR